MAIENRDVFTLGIIILIIGFVLTGFPVYEDAPRLVDILRILGVLIVINSGIFIFISGIWDSEDLFKVGFGVGMGAIGLLFGSEIGNTIFILNTISILPMRTLIWLLLFEGDSFMQFLVIISMPASIRELNITLVRAIVTFILAGVIVVLEIIALQKTKAKI